MVEVGSNYNSVKSFTSGDLRMLLVYFCQIFFRIYGECSASRFMTNIFYDTKLHQYVGLILIKSLANMLAQFVPVYKFMNIRFYH